MKKRILKLTAVAFGAIFAVSLAVNPVANAADNTFGMTELSKGGYMIAASTAKHERDAKKYIRRGLDRRGEGDYRGAKMYFSWAIKLDPNNPFAYFNRGLVNFYERNYHDAKADLDKAIGIYPNYAFAHSVRAGVRSALGDERGAREDRARADEIYSAP